MSMQFHGERTAPPGGQIPNPWPGDAAQVQPTARAAARIPETIPPFSDLVEVECEDCGGSGYDCGSTNEFEPEYCPRCLGSGKELILRNYLAEAFHIVSDPEYRVELCREQIVALATYARQTVSALFSADSTSHKGRIRNQDSGGDLRW